MSNETNPVAIANSSALLTVRGLSVSFATPSGLLPAVEHLDLDVGHGECVGVVGESGSGKSVAALSLLGLHHGADVTGSALFEGRELIGASERELRALRGTEIGLVFQDPLSALNPVATIGDQITEVIRIRGVGRKAAREQAIDILERVGVTRAASRIDDYPHQFSGGMRQRVLIAAAVIAEPKLLIADEPTTALDVRVQAQVLDLIRDLSEERKMSVILITHDLGVVAGFTERVYVMYAGRVLESSSTESLFHDAAHPYTWGLMGSLPRIDVAADGPLQAIPGQPPSPFNRPSGCVFADRCSHAREACWLERPPLLTVTTGNSNKSACLFADELRAVARG